MKVLVVDDDQSVRELVARVMLEMKHEVSVAASGKEALEQIANRDFDLVFCDVVMDGLSGFDVLKTLQHSVGSQAEIVLMTGQASIDAAMDAVQHGAVDYVCKPLPDGILKAIASTAEQRRRPADAIEVRPPACVQSELIGNSAEMIEVVKSAIRVAGTDLPVLICGESGTGKELVGRLIHRASLRAGRPFVTVNCGALPDTLLESELFGHTRGAFTGADLVRRGLFEEADGGTLLLDEVTETSSAFQVKLLRALQEGEIRPLGSSLRKKVNVRVLAATNRSPRAMVDAGLFRRDLLYRLQGFVITMPTLRQRREDIKPMAMAFLGNYVPKGRQLAIAREAMLALENYAWPGNVRELKHLMLRLAAMNKGLIRLEDLPSELVTTPAAARVMSEIIPEGSLPTLDQIESKYMLRVLSSVRGNKSRAAQVMGVDRKTLYRMIDRQAAGHVGRMR